MYAFGNACRDVRASTPYNICSFRDGTLNACPVRFEIKFGNEKIGSRAQCPCQSRATSWTMQEALSSINSIQANGISVPRFQIVLGPETANNNASF